MPPRSDLRSPGKISRPGEPPHSRWEFSQKRRARKNDTGKPGFGGTGLGPGPSLYFSGKLLYFKLHIETNVRSKVMQGQLL